MVAPGVGTRSTVDGEVAVVWEVVDDWGTVTGGDIIDWELDDTGAVAVDWVLV